MSESKTAGLRDVYIVDGARTPFLKAKGKNSAALRATVAPPLVDTRDFRKGTVL